MLFMLGAAVAAALRIISLAPSLTEDLFAIGAGPHVIAVDNDSERPAAALRLPHVGVMMGISAEKILSFSPDLVVGIAYQAPLLTQLTMLGVRTAILPDASLRDDFATMATLGRLSGRPAQAHARIAETQRAIGRITASARDLPWREALAIVGTAPVYAAGRGTYLNELLQLAHLHNRAAQTGPAWPVLSAEDVGLWQPSYLIAPSSLPLPDAPPWNSLQAVQRGCVIRVNADDLERPGPRVVQALERIVTVRRERRC